MVSEQTRARIQHDLDARFGWLGVWLYRATRGRIVRAVELTDAEAKQWWPKVVAIAPTYARIPERTTRRIPFIRLVSAA